MLDKPRRQPQPGFGKRGAMPVPRLSQPEAAPSEAASEDRRAGGFGGILAVPKWAIGAVAALFLLMLVTMSGGVGGGGFLGGLLGGLLANKLFNSGKSTTAQRPVPPTGGVTPDGAARSTFSPSASAPSAASNPGAQSVTRGGFGGTGAGHSSGGFFGGG